MTFKLLCLGAAAALVIAPATFAQTSAPMGAQNPTQPTATPTAPTAPAQPGPAQTADPSANVGSAANANATVGGTPPDAACTAATKKTKHGSAAGSTANCATSNGSQTTTPAPDATAPAGPTPSGPAPTAPQ